MQALHHRTSLDGCTSCSESFVCQEASGAVMLQATPLSKKSFLIFARTRYISCLVVTWAIWVWRRTERIQLKWSCRKDPAARDSSPTSCDITRSRIGCGQAMARFVARRLDRIQSLVIYYTDYDCSFTIHNSGYDVYIIINSTNEIIISSLGCFSLLLQKAFFPQNYVCSSTKKINFIKNTRWRL